VKAIMKFQSRGFNPEHLEYEDLTVMFGIKIPSECLGNIRREM